MQDEALQGAAGHGGAVRVEKTCRGAGTEKERFVQGGPAGSAGDGGRIGVRPVRTPGRVERRR